MLSHPLPQARRELWLPLLERDFGGEEEHTTRVVFRIPQEWRERTLLRFAAVDWRATVTLDGVGLGMHEGGYTHFTFDAGALEPDSEHELVIEAYDPHDAVTAPRIRTERGEMGPAACGEGGEHDETCRRYRHRPGDAGGQ